MTPEAPKRPRIAVLTSAHPYGDPRIFERDCTAFLEWGCEVHAFFLEHEPLQRRSWDAHPRFHLHCLPAASGRLGRMLQALRFDHVMAGEGAFDLVHFHDPELIPAMILSALKRPGTYHLYDVHEELPVDVASKPWLPSGLRRPVARLTGWLWKLAAGVLDGFAPATEAIALWWPAAQTRVVRNYPKGLFDLGDPLPPDPDRVVVAGSLTRGRGILELLAAMAIARETRPGLRLEVYGRISEPELEGPLAAAVAAGWCTHAGFLPQDELARRLRGAGIGTCLLRPQPNYLESLPTKFFEYMALGVPILASDFPFWEAMVEGCGAGRRVAPEPRAIAGAILAMAADPEALAACGRAGRDAYLTRYRWEVEARSLAWHAQRAGLALDLA